MVKAATNLENPIDVQYLMHEAYCSVSLKVEKIAHDLQNEGDLESLKAAFGVWGKHLLHHAVAEDTYMTGPLQDSTPARDNEAEHAALGTQAKKVGAFLRKGDDAALEESLVAILEFEDRQHRELEARLKDVKDLLAKQDGRRAVNARFRRHLYSRIVALRVAQFDHFENEEVLVLPVVRDRMDERQQLEVARRLLIDETAKDPRWIIDVVAQELDPEEQRLLFDLESRWRADDR